MTALLLRSLPAPFHSTRHPERHSEVVVHTRDTTMHVTASWGGEEVVVEVGEGCRSLAALKDAVCSALPEEVDGETVCLEVRGRAMEEEDVLALSEGGRVDVVPPLAVRAAATLSEEGRDVDGSGLHEAVRDGDMRLCGLYLDAGVSCCPELIHMAVAQQNIELCTLLLDRGGEDVTNDLNTPLHLAVCKRNTELCRILLDRGADVNAEGGEWFDEDEDDDRGGSLEMDESDTPLHLAVRGESTELCRLLLERGGDVHAQNHWIRTPLHEAVVARRTKGQGCAQAELCTLLIDGGSDLEEQNEWGRTPLHEAVARKNTGLCKLLLDRGADVNAESAEDFSSLRPSYDGQVTRIDKRVTPLHLAASGGSTELCRLLVERRARTSAWNAWGRTPLQEALLAGHTELSPVLHRDAPLHDAVAEGNTELCTRLLDQGADVNAVNDDLTTPLHLAVFNENIELCTLLIDRGSKLEAKDAGETPLHEAVRGYNTKLCKLLLDRGADVNAKNDEGETPLDYIYEQDYTELCTLLLGRGDAAGKGRGGWTPLQRAVGDVYDRLRRDYDEE